MQFLKNFLKKLARKHKVLQFILDPVIRWRQQRIKKRANRLFKKYAGELLQKFKNSLDERNLMFWLTAGTLLGAYREKRFLPHDSDLDVAIWCTDCALVKQALLANGFVLKSEFGVVGMGVTEMAFSYKGVRIDVFFTYKVEDKFVNYIFFKDTDSPAADDFRVIEMFLPETDFVNYEFCGGSYLIPARTKEYLSANYGPNFMIPDKGWSYTKDIPSAIYHPLEVKRGYIVKY